MPNRIIKETIRTSRNVNMLTDFEFRVWIYLITYVDDMGRGSADPELLKGLVFPRRKGITVKQIQSALETLANAGMVKLYDVDGEPYLYFPKWSEHQRIRNSVPKFPEPSCGELRRVAARRGKLRPESNTIQSNTESNPESESIICSEPSSEPPVITLRLNDGSEYGLTETQVSEWISLYPAVDVLQELRNMKGWCEANPTKRKTKSGILRFVNAWLAKEQDRGGKPSTKPAKGHYTAERKDDLDTQILQGVLARMTG